MGDSVRLDLDGPIAVVTLDAPPLNIFDLEMRDGLIEALSAVDDIDGLQTMVLAAAGDHFSAGADLSEFGTAASIHEARRIRWDRDPWALLWDLPIPTIAALHGVAVGSGMEMAMLCDIRVAGPSTKLGLPESKLGMLPAAGGTQSLTKTIGPHGAVPVVALADTMTDQQALHRGIVTELAPDADRRAMDRARQFAGYDRAALRALKRCLRAAVDRPLDAGLELERRLARSIGADPAPS